MLINTYHNNVKLFIDGDALLSQEGTTQGDPLAMAMYTIAITPFITSLEDEETKQVCFADDATTASQHPNITKAEQLQIKRILVKAKNTSNNL